LESAPPPPKQHEFEKGEGREISIGLRPVFFFSMRAFVLEKKKKKKGKREGKNGWGVPRRIGIVVRHGPALLVHFVRLAGKKKKRRKETAPALWPPNTAFEDLDNTPVSAGEKRGRPGPSAKNDTFSFLGIEENWREKGGGKKSKESEKGFGMGLGR